MLASSVVLEQEINSAAIASEMKQVIFFHFVLRDTKCGWVDADNKKVIL